MDRLLLAVYKILTTTQPTFLYNLISVQPLPAVGHHRSTAYLFVVKINN